MAYFSVSYQLNKDKDYKPLWAEMKRLGAHKAMNDYYLLDINLETALAVQNHLKKFIDDVDDMIFVAKLDSKPASHKCYKGTAAWIDERF